MKEMNTVKIQKKYFLKLFGNTMIGMFFLSLFYVFLAFSQDDPAAGLIVFGLLFFLSFAGSIIGIFFRLVWLNFFKYEFDDDYIVAYQGIISRQERHLPYVVMQDIIIMRDIMDRLLGLATIIVENASAVSGVQMYQTGANAYGAGANNRYAMYPIGMNGNKFVLSGITNADAEMLKNKLLNLSTKTLTGKGNSQVL